MRSAGHNTQEDPQLAAILMHRPTAVSLDNTLPVRPANLTMSGMRLCSQTSSPTSTNEGPLRIVPILQLVPRAHHLLNFGRNVSTRCCAFFGENASGGR